ncbi:somatostatin receptor type 5-like [Branchiostoma floridae]|uniref:Somatostatin receptor type 5-like n=2 Tax=Branchiostoma floridae TaxID=7739 RepID=A0A9J7KPP5_BRAFL|nr:somatostatin receptor type 5-like [Branchiostoma floridae]
MRIPDDVTIGNWSSTNETDYVLMSQVVSDPLTTIVGPVLYGTVTTVGLLGNLLVIYVLLGHTRVKDATKYYILNLSFADTLFMLGIPFISASAAIGRWVFGRAMCKIVLSMDAINMFTTVFNMAVLSVDRYLAIVRASSHPHLRQPKVAVAVSLSVWLAAIVLAIPVMTVSDTVMLMNGDYVCMLDWPADNVMLWYEAFISYTFAMGFVAPLSVISVSYVMVIRHLRRNTSTHAAVARASAGVRNKVTKTVSAIVVTFVVCWLPFHVCQLLNLITDLPLKPMLAVSHVAMVMSYANSCVNPILYVFMSQKFRKSVRNALRLSRKKAGLDLRGYNQNKDTAVARQRRQIDAFFEEEICEVKFATVESVSPQGVVVYVTSV